MKLLSITILSIFFFPIVVFGAAGPAASLFILPEKPIQGDPLFISVAGLNSTTTVESISFGAKPLGVFYYLGKLSAFYGFDLNKKAGVFTLSARLSDGTIVSKKVLVGERTKEQVAFTIPAKLGGNTLASQTKLVSTLADENTGLLGLVTGKKAYWRGNFSFPVATPFVTDTYGYSRATGATTVTHKGADFRAPSGTPILAINRGVIRLVRETRNYGKTIVIDHGLGLQSFYMHLSRIDVREGDLVSRGQAIGLSGQTGYAESPHLHLSIRINEASIDPLVFLNFFR